MNRWIVAACLVAAGCGAVAMPAAPGADSGAASDLAQARPADGGVDSGGVSWSALDDDFTGAALSPSWSVLHPELVSVAVGGGALTLTPAPSLWFNASEGPLVYKTVPAGDFSVTSTVHARKASNPSQPPDQVYALGGLMARRTGSPPNYVFLVVGHNGAGLCVEHKTTTDGVSTFVGPPWSSGDAELRICRVGTTMRLYQRHPGDATWTPALSINRPDLAGELEVGVNAYANTATPDLVVVADGVRFSGDVSPGECP